MLDIASLLAGFKRFRHQYYVTSPDLYRQLSKQQAPTALVIACCDSRLQPAQLLDVVPGELFVTRNIANIVPPYVATAQHPDPTSAAIEFAVGELQVAHIIVLGHHDCGGINYLLTGDLTKQSALACWVSTAADLREPMLHQHPDDLAARSRACELANIALSLQRLKDFPIVQRRIQKKELSLHGWYFDMLAGQLLTVDS